MSMLKEENKSYRSVERRKEGEGTLGGNVTRCQNGVL